VVSRPRELEPHAPKIHRDRRLARARQFAARGRLPDDIVEHDAERHAGFAAVIVRQRQQQRWQPGQCRQQRRPNVVIFWEIGVIRRKRDANHAV
jgi:hypothetical protein